MKEIQQLIFIKNVLAMFKIEALYLITLFYYLYFTTMWARKNNLDHVMAAHIQFVLLFYLFQHLEYQLFTFALCGKGFRCLKSCKIIYALVRALGVCGKENAAQGGDFHQEELNKCINAFSVQLCPQKTSGRKSVVLFPLLILLL